MAAKPLFRLLLRRLFPLEPEELGSSCSEITLQSSLGAPPPLEL